MKKKIIELTSEEMEEFCEKQERCDNCELVMYTYTDHICLKEVIMSGRLESEIEV